ncbi:MAG: hypothetical protein M3Y32_14700 [Pseudomonadota bacterium]|nr:hypothetical protein [Pseudomonadota bacterium]
MTPTRAAGAALWLLLVLTGAAAAAPYVSGIYSCTDDRNRRLTADRPIAECSGREQQILNRDGSLKAVLPATLTADERAAQEARDRAAAEQRTTRADAVRRDRNLMSRYPNAESHDRAREAALDSVRLAVKSSELRMRNLALERKPLVDEAEFYLGRSLPMKLRMQLEANDAAAEAQRAAVTFQEAEIVRINKLYDAELDRLRRLWAGAQPGSLGAIPAQGAARSAADPLRAPQR